MVESDFSADLQYLEIIYASRKLTAEEMDSAWLWGRHLWTVNIQKKFHALKYKAAVILSREYETKIRSLLLQWDNDLSMNLKKIKSRK